MMIDESVCVVSGLVPRSRHHENSTTMTSPVTLQPRLEWESCCGGCLVQKKWAVRGESFIL